MARTFKRVSALTVILLLILVISSVYAQPAYADAQHMFSDEGFFTTSELTYVDDYLTELSEKLKFDIVGALIYEGYYDDELTGFADDFYDYGNFGYGPDKDGVIFVVDMKSRQMVLVSTGYGITAITDYGEEVIYDYVTESLRNENFVEVFERYADTVEDYVQMAREGTPVDSNAPGHDGYEWYEGDPEGTGYNLPDAETAAGMGGISLIFGSVVGFFSSHRHKARLKTVNRKTQANSYARRGSLVLTRQQDRFLYRNVVVQHRPKNENKGSFGGGGTTIHMGSSGTPHGGGHARGF